ncbi:MFS transporter [Spirosoma aureum]|uniref:MFS transporter n=1 Tax=Spirosoma aureum TaxID=2692134 RepID=A0A6G9AST3_9BACT|nr:MFS transporter [Spirosoma aureum]QIP15448.1 MFS transporter [Spirosoma aureum]
MDEVLTSSRQTITDQTNWFAFGLCFGCYVMGGTVSTLLSVFLPVILPEFGANASSGAVLNAAFLYGWVGGGLGFGLVADRIGRVRSLTIATALVGFFTLLCVWASSWPMMAAFRFMAGMGVGGVLVITTIYLSEIWPERGRAVILGLLAMSFPVGIVLAGSMNLLFAQWRTAFWLGVIPLVLALLVAQLLPESRHWQATRSTGKSSTQSLWQPQYRLNLVQGSLIFSAVLIGLWAVFSWTPSWIQTLFVTDADARQARGITMMLFGIGGILGGAVSGLLVNKLGMRTTLLGTFACCLFACWLLFGTNQTFSPLIYAETALLSLCFGVSQGTLSSFVPLLFPIAIRATASGFSFNVGRVLTATGVFFVGSLVAVFGGLGNALLFFSLTFALAFTVTWFSRRATSV